MKARLFTLLAAMVMLAARPAVAQSTDPYFATFSANYDVVYHELDETSNAGAHFDVSSTIKRDIPFVGLTGEAGFNHFDGGTVASVLGGLRLRIPDQTRQILPFAQVLVGLYHCGVCGVDDFALQGGGGVDFRLRTNRNFRIRAQLDVRHVFDQVAFNAVRLSAGIVLPLNR